MELARIEHKRLTEEDVAIDNLRAAINGRPDRRCQPGTYAVLFTRRMVDGKPTDGWVLMMSDTPYEIRSGNGFIWAANGHVLILGLGLGATTIPVLEKKEVTKVTVIERNIDVIELVAPHLKNVPGGNKLDIVWADAFEWKPPKALKFDTIWMDIWPSISEDNLPEMTKLKRKYTRRLNRKNPKSWMRSWEEGYLRNQRRKSREL